MFTMDRRLKLHQLLREIPDVKEVYFQAPGKDLMVYPCIIYELGARDVQHANNSPYRNTKRYEATVIDRKVDSTIPDAVAALPLTSFSRRYVATQLHHEVFNIYF